MKISKYIWHKIRVYISTRPILFYAAWRLKKKNIYTKNMGVTRSSRLVIEAYPRSGNTFASFAFILSQSQDALLAHHLHVAAQILRAIDYNIPALVIIRKPEDAIKSYLVRHPELDEITCIKEYISFYSVISNFRDKFVTAKFEEVVNDFGKVVEKVNSKFGTNFETFDASPENTANVFSEISRVNDEGGQGLAAHLAIPSEAKKKIRDQVSAFYFCSDKSKALLSEANQIYVEFTGCAQR